MSYGKGALLAKFDLKRAYCSFHVPESVRHLLGMTWGKNFMLTLPYHLVYRRPLIFPIEVQIFLCSRITTVMVVYSLTK